MDRVSMDEPVAPILVIGLGNILLADDGVGPRLVRELKALYAGVDGLECIDGGTQGLALLGYLGRRQSVVILDAFASGRRPGDVTVLDRAALIEARASRSTTAHEGNAAELLATAHLLDELPERVFLVGIEPERVQTECALSDSVLKSLPAAFTQACEIIEHELSHLQNMTAA